MRHRERHEAAGRERQGTGTKAGHRRQGDKGETRTKEAKKREKEKRRDKKN